MSAPAVRVEGLGKRFRHTLPRQRTLLGRLLRRSRSGPPMDAVWALRGVSFEVGHGECLGISGPNGAGKSTLLRLVAGILEPTEGSARVDGRANTFFQIQAGLQPEMSVRDNIEICGILMGLRRRDILGRTERILEFSELGRYADVRMAELSTGQAARVAFSTAIHADLQILLVDEMLSVGDAAFQARCLGAFSSLMKEGKTVLVASHDFGPIEGVLTQRLRLDQGRVAALEKRTAGKGTVPAGG